jgi:putative ABC transport system substrate-binding protein
MLAVFASSTSPEANAVRAGLRELGHLDGQTVSFAFRSAGGDLEQLDALAIELLQLPADVIVTGGEPALHALLRMTTTVPVVMHSALDPVASGYVTSLARPDRNVTGVTTVAPHLMGKRLELLAATLPGLSRVAALSNTANVYADEWRETQTAAAMLGLETLLLDARGPADLDAAFQVAVREHADAVVALSGTTSLDGRRAAELATQYRLPAMFTNATLVEAGGLMAYGPNRLASYQRTAYYVDRILKGAKPADLPVEQPMRFDFAINLKTARTLGLTIPPHVLLQATELIQ